MIRLELDHHDAMLNCSFLSVAMIDRLLIEFQALLCTDHPCHWCLRGHRPCGWPGFRHHWRGAVCSADGIHNPEANLTNTPEVKHGTWQSALRKRRFLLETIIFRFHVKLWGSSIISLFTFPLQIMVVALSGILKKGVWKIITWPFAVSFFGGEWLGLEATVSRVKTLRKNCDLERQCLDDVLVVTVWLLATTSFSRLCLE